jgi:hypothetical protein
VRLSQKSKIYHLMKGKSVSYSPMIFLLISSLAFSSCVNRFKCDASNQVRLGEIDYSATFKEWEIEVASDLMKFTSSNETISLKKREANELPFKRLNEYLVCKSINIKPYRAYAYYEYKNLSSHFASDEMSVVIEPDISKEEGKRAESIYLTFYKAGASNSIKARVPVTNLDLDKPREPFGVLFTFHDSIMLEDRNYTDVWMYKEENMAIYYNKENGIVALESDQTIFHRVK